MNKTRKRDILPHHQKRLDNIGIMLHEMRFAEGKNQDSFSENGITRRQIQRGEYSSNLTLVRLFRLIDCHGYTLSEFFEGMQ